MNVPDDCKENELCKWIKKKLPDDAKITLTGIIYYSLVLVHQTIITKGYCNADVETAACIANFNRGFFH